MGQYVQTEAIITQPSTSEGNPAENLRFVFGTDVFVQWLTGIDYPGVMLELVQNEYDANGSRLEVCFGNDTVQITGNGNPVDASGWRRLSVMLGTGPDTETGREVPVKSDGIGSKNHGLRTLFLFGDRIFVKSAGLRTELNVRKGALSEPLSDPATANTRGIRIEVPYRAEPYIWLEPFDLQREQRVLQLFADQLGPMLIKLARPGYAKSLRELLITSERCGRTITWKQSVQRQQVRAKGITALRRSIRMDDSSAGGLDKLQEIEYQKELNIPRRFHSHQVPEYFRLSPTQLRIAVSLPIQGRKIRLDKVGLFFYPIGVVQGYTDTCVSLNAPFIMNSERTRLADPSTSEWNAWLLDELVELTLELLISDWLQKFGADAYLAVVPRGSSAMPWYCERLEARLREGPYWPTRARDKRAKLPQFVTVSALAVPDRDELDGFLGDVQYLDNRLYKKPRLQALAKEFGASRFGLSHLVRLRCFGKEAGRFNSEFAEGERRYYYPTFPEELLDGALQQKFGRALDACLQGNKLKDAHREALRTTPTTLAADGSLQPLKHLWMVDTTLADSCPVEPSLRLHPCLHGSRIISSLCTKYDPNEWISETVKHIKDGTASEDTREVLYRILISGQFRINPHTREILRDAPILKDHRGDWVAPASITTKKAKWAKDCTQVLHFPHTDYQNSPTVTKLFQFRSQITADDIIALASHVAADPADTESALKFENLLSRVQALLQPEDWKRLQTIPFLLSTSGALSRPCDVFVHNTLNQCCLGPTASYAVGKKHDLHERLGCVARPSSNGIVQYLLDLRDGKRQPEHLDIVYPALVDALEREHLPRTTHKSSPILWTGRGFESPDNTLVTTRFGDILLDSVAQVGSIPERIRTAYRTLGAHQEPQAQHWQQFFQWLHQRYEDRNRSLLSEERRALLGAYVRLVDHPVEIDSDVLCFLSEDGTLHSSADVRAGRYVINDDPRMAEAIRKEALPIYFADTHVNQSGKVLQFLRSRGVQHLSNVRKRVGYSVREEVMPSLRLKWSELLEELHDRGFRSALKAYIDHKFLHSSNAGQKLVSELGDVSQFVFAKEIHITYQVCNTSVAVPVDVVFDSHRIAVIPVRSQTELLELVAQAIVSIVSSATEEDFPFTDAIYRLLICHSDFERRTYLSWRGVPWEPTDPEEVGAEFADDIEMDEGQVEYGDTLSAVGRVVTANLASRYPLSAELTAMDGQAREPAAPAYELNSISQLGTLPTSSVLPEPPRVEDVTPRHVRLSGKWTPRSLYANGSGTHTYTGGSGGFGGSDNRRTNIGHRGEKIAFDDEVKRVQARGQDPSKVIHVSERRPKSDHDIQSVDEDGNPIWIEVKATVGKDGRFEWSTNELVRALLERDRYWLYRVYEVESSTPSISRIQDPIALLLQNKIGVELGTLRAEVEPLSLGIVEDDD